MAGEHQVSKKFNLKSKIVASLRRLSYQWPPRKEVVRKARLRRGIYKCNICQGEFGPKEINVDHIIPVVDITTGWVSWDIFIERLFCEEEGFQICCITCHDIKTLEENKKR